LIRVNNALPALLGLLLVSLMGSAGPILAEVYPPTNEIISNDIYLLAGGSDTLWMLTSKGLNYTNSITDSPIVWSGFKNVNGYAINFSRGMLLGCLQPVSGPNDLWLFRHQTNNYSIIELKYQTALFDSLDTTSTFAFYGIDAVLLDNAFWVACMDGGLLKLDPSGFVAAIFYPGKDTTAYSFTSFTPASLAPDTLKKPDRAKRVIAVAADSLLVWAACEKGLWRFSPKDTAWTKINDSTLFFSEYVDVKTRSRADTAFVYATISRIGTKDTTYMLYVYNSKTAHWTRVIQDNFTTLPVIQLGARGYIYVLNPANNEIKAYRQPAPDSVAVAQSANFRERILKAGSDLVNVSINDIHYAIHAADTIFAVATDVGLLYSKNEHRDEADNTPFIYENRMVLLTPGLEKTYAIPGIINNYHPEAIFAYNLVKDDRVTIDIFDYNNDFVTRIIDNAPRLAGSHRTSGRSTVPQYDKWDGTARGRVVSPGVYIYRIKTKNGKQAFGKIIVAKN